MLCKMLCNQYAQRSVIRDIYVVLEYQTTESLHFDLPSTWKFILAPIESLGTDHVCKDVKAHGSFLSRQRCRVACAAVSWSWSKLSINMTLWFFTCKEMQPHVQTAIAFMFIFEDTSIYREKVWPRLWKVQLKQRWRVRCVLKQNLVKCCCSSLKEGKCSVTLLGQRFWARQNASGGEKGTIFIYSLPLSGIAK